jgi:hypothetical protein
MRPLGSTCLRNTKQFIARSLADYLVANGSRGRDPVIRGRRGRLVNGDTSHWWSLFFVLEVIYNAVIIYNAGNAESCSKGCSSDVTNSGRAASPMKTCKVVCYGMLWYAMVCYGMLWYAMVCYGMLCYGMLCYAMVCYAMVWYAMLCYAMVWYGMLCYAMLCYAMLCYGMVWYGMVWYGMLWYAMVCYGMRL